MRAWINLVEDSGAERPRPGEPVDPGFLDEVNPDNVWYHGTKTPDFRLAWQGTGERGDMNGLGFYLTNDPDYAQKFAAKGLPLVRVEILEVRCVGEPNGLYGAPVKQWALTNGYDSVMRHIGGGAWEIVVYDPATVRILP